MTLQPVTNDNLSRLGMGCKQGQILVGVIPTIGCKKAILLGEQMLLNSWTLENYRKYFSSFVLSCFCSIYLEGISHLNLRQWTRGSSHLKNFEILQKITIVTNF